MRLLLEGCKKNDRESQRLLYQHYYAYAMSICMRYCRSIEEAKEILNDGFMKVFQKIDQHETELSFKAWLRRIMIHTAIDHYRKQSKHYYHSDVSETKNIASASGNVLDELSHTELIAMVQQLSPAYRAVFNLHVIDGYTHEEIAEILNISAGTSKSNLAKARENLRKEIEKVNRKGAVIKYV